MCRFEKANDNPCDADPYKSFVAKMLDCRKGVCVLLITPLDTNMGARTTQKDVQREEAMRDVLFPVLTAKGDVAMRWISLLSVVVTLFTMGCGPEEPSVLDANGTSTAGRGHSLGGQQSATECRVQCAANLKQIVMAFQCYAKAHEGQFPSELTELCPEYLKSEEFFFCPGDRGVQGGEQNNSALSYEIVPGLSTESAPTTILIKEIGEDNHEPKGHHVCSVNGRVTFVRASR